MRTEAEVDSLQSLPKSVLKPSREQHWRGRADRYRPLVGGRDSEERRAAGPAGGQERTYRRSILRDKECLLPTKRMLLDHRTVSDDVQPRMLAQAEVDSLHKIRQYMMKSSQKQHWKSRIITLPSLCRRKNVRRAADLAGGP